MGFWNNIFGMFSIGDEQSGSHIGCDINPGSGLPMVDGCGGVDIAGNTWGTDHSWSDSSNLDSFDSFTSAWDDPFSGNSVDIDTWSD